MDKKLLSTVIAAAIAAPMSVMADTTLYGKIHMSVGSIDSTDTNGNSADEFAVRSHSSRMGVKGSEDLGNGLKANFNLEWEVMPDMDDSTGAGDVALGTGQRGGAAGGWSRRNQWVGLSGDSWGEIRIGRHDTPLKMAQGKFDVFNDTDGDIGGVLVGEDRVDNVVAYLSNDFSGFSFAGALVAGEGEDAYGDAQTSNDGLADIYSLAAMYGNGPLFASIGYTAYGENATAANATQGQTPNAEESVWRLIGTYNVTDDLMVGGLYSSYDGDANNADGDAWGLSAKFSMGSNAVKFQYLTSEWETGAGDDEQTEWSIGLDHSFSKRTTAYVMYNDDVYEYAAAGASDDEYDSFTVGVIHKF